jgi:uncharacterized Ntn-hydrolase superfamily protein
MSQLGIEMNTFSITARDASTGQLGVAVSTKLPCVGALCPFVKAGVGAISTQSFVNPYLGVYGLEYMADGMGAEETLVKLMEADEYREIRQIAMVDTNGQAAAFSGNQCTQWYGHIVGDGYAVAGNMLTGESTITSMRDAYEGSGDQDLAERLVRALEAGQAAGGDRRGKQSAAIYVVSTEAYGLVDIRVDDHPEPVGELRRIFEVAKEELYPIHHLMATRDNFKGDLSPEFAKEYRERVEAIPVDD